MFTSSTASREKALKASDAAMRAMERHECCKSHFKFMCFSCGEMINRGDKITKCTASRNDGMRLRFRGADARNGLTDEETAFYLAETGTRTWVHIGCNPVFWTKVHPISLPNSLPNIAGFTRKLSVVSGRIGEPRFRMSSRNGANSPITMIWKSFWKNTDILR